MKELLSEVYSEFKNLNYEINIDPRTNKESYNLFKQADGQWFKVSKAGLHEAISKTAIDLNTMPALLKLTQLINEKDPEAERIFITELLVYKIKKGTQTTILSAYPTIESKGPFQKLCEEISTHGLEKDRHRDEETYLLTKSPKGEWSISSSHENHSGTKKVLSIDKMPLLKAASLKICKLDPQFQSNGGRIFITPTRIYRLKNKVELDYKI